MKLERADYIRSLEQLLTISCILAGFSVSGLIAIPGMETVLYSKIVSYFNGNLDIGFYCSFYCLFFSAICYLSTIMIVLVYKINNFFVPIGKLTRVYFIANIVFSLAIASLVVGVITFAIPTWSGFIASALMGFGIAFCFIWENMVPWQRHRREEQMKKEQEQIANGSRPDDRVL